MAWWKGGNKQQKREEEAGSDLSSPGSKAVEQTSGVVSSTLHVVQDAATDAAERVTEAVVAVGAEQREAVRMENREIWGKVKEGDTLWGLSEKYLGDGTKWPYLHAACRKELGPDPLRLLPGTHVTEACVARARESSRRSRN